MFFEDDARKGKRRSERVGFAPFDALLEKVRADQLGSWRSVEADFLAAVTAFDTEYATGCAGKYQLRPVWA